MSQLYLLTGIKVLSFMMSEYCSTEGTFQTDYYNRFGWALHLSSMLETQYANFTWVYMRAELKNAPRFLITPRDPVKIPYTE